MIKIKKLILLIGMFLLTCFAKGVDNDPSEIHIYIINANQMNSQVSPLELACWKYTGSQLCECLDKLSWKDRNKNIMVLEASQRHDFFIQKLTTSDDYKQFCDSFSVSEWQKFYYMTTEQERAFFPRQQEEVEQLITIMTRDAIVHEAALESNECSIIRKSIACASGMIISPFFLCLAIASSGFKAGVQETLQEVKKPFLHGTVDQIKLQKLFETFKKHALQ